MMSAPITSSTPGVTMPEIARDADPISAMELISPTAMAAPPPIKSVTSAAPIVGT